MDPHDLETMTEPTDSRHDLQEPQALDEAAPDTGSPSDPNATGPHPSSEAPSDLGSQATHAVEQNGPGGDNVEGYGGGDGGEVKGERYQRLEGQRLGNYEVISLLGKGGMGEVYLARHPMLGREVAVKVLTAEADPKGVARFQREAKAACRIGHPNIVEVLDFGQLPDGREYALMERLQGETLGEHLARQGRLDPHEAYEILNPLMEALYDAHTKGIVHRDLKPDNIFLAQERDEMVPKLLDFGIAKLTPTLEDAPLNTTATGMILGTPLYMSPEQASGNTKKVRRASDIYSLGAVLFHMLTGRTPFSGESYGELLIHHMQTPPPKLSSHRDDLPPGLDKVVETAMAKEPEDRYADMVLMKRALREALGLPFYGESTLDTSSPRAGAGATDAKEGNLLNPLAWKPSTLWVVGGGTLFVFLVAVTAVVLVALEWRSHGSKPARSNKSAKTIQKSSSTKSSKVPKSTKPPKTSKDPTSPREGNVPKTAIPEKDLSKKAPTPSTRPHPDTLPTPSPGSALYRKVMRHARSYDPRTSWVPPTHPSITGAPQPRGARVIQLRLARQFLKTAKDSLKKKRFSSARQWALISYRKHASNEAAQLVGVASCRLKDPKMARQALKRTSKKRAAAIRAACKKAGVALDSSQ